MSSSQITEFIVPPPFGEVGNYADLPSYGIGTTLNIQWTTTAPETELWLLQDGEGLSCSALNFAKISCVNLGSANRGKSWTWPIQQPSNYSVSAPVYYLSLQDPSQRGGFGLATSHYINLLPKELVPSSTSPTATFSTTTTSLGSPTSTNAASTTLVSPTAATTGEASDASGTAPEGVSSTTKVAIGVSIGVAVPLIIVLGIIAWFLYRNHARKRGRHGVAAGPTNPPAYLDGMPEATQSSYTKHAIHNPHEYNSRHEMPVPGGISMDQNYRPVNSRVELPSTPQGS